MTEAIRIGDPPIEVRLRRHGGARRMVLRVCRTAATPVLTLPPSVSLAHARSFALDQEGWLRRQIAAAPGRILVRDGADLPFRGEIVRVARAPSGRTGVADGVLRVAGPEGRLGVRAATFLREAARQRCLAAVESHAARLGRPFGRITLRDTRGRWGSCTGAGDLMFSWRLILAPDEVLDYVAAHEVAHLAEMNHSQRFWDAVARLRPNHAAARDWLRRHGPGLMAYDFTGARGGSPG